MGWFPYPSASGADQFYAFFYDSQSEEELVLNRTQNHSTIDLGK